MSVAEPVANGRVVTARDDEPLFEVVNGIVGELPPMSFHASKIASRLVRIVGSFANANELGEVVGETLFRLPLEENRADNRRPDVAFVSYKAGQKANQNRIGTMPGMSSRTWLSRSSVQTTMSKSSWINLVNTSPSVCR